jgi:hypothetical protein
MAKMLLVLSDMRGLGYEIVPFDTLRTPKEAEKFAARGVGSKRSMHVYGVACDCICGKHGWDCVKNDCAFFTDYGRIVESHGLVWGGNFDRDPSTDDRLDDRPHAQGVTVGQQPVLRALRDDAARERFIAARLCKLAKAT